MLCTGNLKINEMSFPSQSSQSTWQGVRGDIETTNFNELC